MEAKARTHIRLKAPLTVGNRACEPKDIIPASLFGESTAEHLVSIGRAEWAGERASIEAEKAGEG